MDKQLSNQYYLPAGQVPLFDSLNIIDSVSKYYCSFNENIVPNKNMLIIWYIS